MAQSGRLRMTTMECPVVAVTEPAVTLSTRCWIGRGRGRHVFPRVLAQLKEQLLKPDDGPNERKPQGRQCQTCCSRLG
jgi:hypothetical protein